MSTHPAIWELLVQTSPDWDLSVHQKHSMLLCPRNCATWNYAHEKRLWFAGFNVIAAVMLVQEGEQHSMLDRKCWACNITRICDQKGPTCSSHNMLFSMKSFLVHNSWIWYAVLTFGRFDFDTGIFTCRNLGTRIVTFKNIQTGIWACIGKTACNLIMEISWISWQMQVLCLSEPSLICSIQIEMLLQCCVRGRKQAASCWKWNHQDLWQRTTRDLVQNGLLSMKSCLIHNLESCEPLWPVGDWLNRGVCTCNDLESHCKKITQSEIWVCRCNKLYQNLQNLLCCLVIVMN